MNRGDWATDVSRLVRASRRGVIRVARLSDLGVPQRTSYRRCLPGGPWRWLLPGIILLTNGIPTNRQRIEAARLHCGDDAILTGNEALRQCGLRGIPDDHQLHLLIPHDQRVQSAGFVHVERTIHLPRPIMRDGIRLAPTARAGLDAARRIREADQVRALLSEVVQRGHCHPAELLAELDSGSQRGSALSRRILNELCQGTRSVAEAHGLAIWRQARLPTARWNIRLFDRAGEFIAMPDAWCDEVALAWEIDSVEFHFGRDAYARTLARNTRYAAAGIIFVQTLPSRLRDDPLGVIRELRAAYEAAKARPRPAVVAHPAPAA